MNRSIEAAARAVCRSGKFETGEGCCAPICMENLGVARDKCQRCVQVHGDFVHKIVNAYLDPDGPDEDVER